MGRLGHGTDRSRTVSPVFDRLEPKPEQVIGDIVL